MTNNLIWNEVETMIFFGHNIHICSIQYSYIFIQTTPIEAYCVQLSQRISLYEENEEKYSPIFGVIYKHWWNI